mmetsp:Transcript_1240/g.2693  ORF Transcript_1240/g.2693 Transcript_1240/m.2693 type:complete len:328 (-) Transcript_1240:232-1215(-)
MPPTTAQQRAIAYAPMIFAAISFVSSSYVIYHLLFQERQKLKRLYHRLVLAMNIALLPLSFTQVWSTMAVPEGTPYYAGAMGTMNTCVVQGFIKLMFMLTVSTYYVSLVLQALMGMRNNFKEENYRWIEIPTHLVAYCIPCMFAILFAVTENINPSGNGCFYAKAPHGCESNPEISCQRGQDIKYIVLIMGAIHISLYFVFPALAVLFMYFRMKKKRKEGVISGSGMTIIREKARKEMTHKVYLQLSIYLISTWSTCTLAVINAMYQAATGDFMYNLLILASCICTTGICFHGGLFHHSKDGGAIKRGICGQQCFPFTWTSVWTYSG